MVFLPACLILQFFSLLSVAQNAPVTTIATVGNAQPGQVSVPITVTGFTNIGACSLSFDYQYAGLHFSSGSPNPLLAGFAIGDQDLGNGKHRITMGWFGNGISLANGTAIMTVTFNLISGITALEFYDNGPSCEYADANYNVLEDIPQSTYYINGMVCTGMGNPGTITGASSLCAGTTGITYSVSPLTNATSYIWSVPPGATIITGNNTNAITVDYSTVASSGNVSVNGVNVCGNGPSSQLAVTVNPLPVASAGNDITIPFGTSTTLHAASGGSGSYNYHWSPEALLVNPNLQNPQTVNLTVTSVFSLKVTDQVSLCQNSDDVIVAISGGPLNSNPISVPSFICRGTPSQLFANAGGGSGSYTYTWTCTPAGTPPWTSSLANPVVTPDSTKTYHLSISDGFNTTSGNTQLTVFQLPSATIHGGDTLCGTGTSTILTVDLTGTPPWTFYYSNGINTWYVPSVTGTPYQITASEAGNYTVLTVTDDHCTGTTSGSAAVALFPVPPTPVISVNGTQLASTGCCGNQWYKEGIAIPGATGQSYDPVVTAHYYTIVTVNGCVSEPSNTVYYLMTGIGQQENSGFYLEPNPVSRFVTIKTRSLKQFAGEIRICSISGQTEAVYPINEVIEPNGIRINIEQLSRGMHFLEVNTLQGKTVIKLVKQ